MSSVEEVFELLRTGSKEIGLPLEKNSVMLLNRFMDMLLKWNQEMNLTAITKPDEVVSKHFLDSLMVLAKVEVGLNDRVVDIGTGAGFPGIPMKIVRPDLQMVLVDSLKKRTNFLEAVVKDLGLRDITVVHARVEDIGHVKEFREEFDLAVSRAVAKLPVLVEYCLPLIKVDGKFIAYKGPDLTEELKTLHNAQTILGAQLVETIETKLPHSKDYRALVIFKKVSSTPARYPRKAGIPEKRPLGVKL